MEDIILMDAFTQPIKIHQRLSFLPVLRKVPLWLKIFLAHEAIVILGLLAPYPTAPTKYIDATQAFYIKAHFLFQWDSLWFIEIAKHGYVHLPTVPYLRGTAFFPWLPILIHIIGSWGALVLTQAAFAISLWVASRVFRRFLSELHQVTTALWLLALNPATVYYASLYAEPWTLLFTLISVELGFRHKWVWAAVLAFLAATTQATGVLVGIFPLVIFVFAISSRSWKDARGPFLWGIGGFLGLVSYMVYLGLRFHQPFLFSTIEHRSWGGYWEWPWLQWYKAIGYSLYHGMIVPLRAALLAAITVLIAGTAMLWRRLRDLTQEAWAIVFYGTAGLLVSLSFSQGWPLHSTIRIASIYFPLYAGVARFPRWLTFLSTIGFAVMAFGGTMLFAHGWWYQ